MTAEEIVEQLRPLGRESYKKVMMRHGVKEPFFGVPIGDMKPIQKQIKKDYQLALDLYDTGIYDAMYLAGLIADDEKMTREDLQKWLDKAPCSAISDVTVAWVAAGSSHGWDMAMKWLAAPDEKSKCAGWATLSSWVAMTPDTDLDIPRLRELLTQIEASIHEQSNDVKYGMNGFVISVGCYVAELTEEALRVGKAIGKVDIELVGDCKLPSILHYIQKVAERGAIGKKRKTVKC